MSDGLTYISVLMMSGEWIPVKHYRYHFDMLRAGSTDTTHQQFTHIDGESVFIRLDRVELFTLNTPVSRAKHREHDALIQSEEIY